MPPQYRGYAILEVWNVKTQCTDLVLLGSSVAAGLLWHTIQHVLGIVWNRIAGMYEVWDALHRHLPG